MLNIINIDFTYTENWGILNWCPGNISGIIQEVTNRKQRIPSGRREIRRNFTW